MPRRERHDSGSSTDSGISSMCPPTSDRISCTSDESKSDGMNFKEAMSFFRQMTNPQQETSAVRRSVSTNRTLESLRRPLPNVSRSESYRKAPEMPRWGRPDLVPPADSGISSMCPPTSDRISCMSDESKSDGMNFKEAKSFFRQMTNPQQETSAVRRSVSTNRSEEDVHRSVFNVSAPSPLRQKRPASFSEGTDIDSDSSSDSGRERHDSDSSSDSGRERTDSDSSSDSGISCKSDESKEIIINFKGKTSYLRKMLDLIATLLEEADSDSSDIGISWKRNGSKEIIINFKAKTSSLRTMLDLIATLLEKIDSEVRCSGTPPQRAESSKTSDESIKDEKSEDPDLEVLKITIQVQKQNNSKAALGVK